MSIIEPILNIKKKKRKIKKKVKYLSSLKELRKIDPNYPARANRPWKPLSEYTPEEYAKFKKDTSRRILERKKRSPRFNKYKNKTINETVYRLYLKKTKICTHCNRELGVIFFDRQKDTSHKKNYRRTYCIDCRKKKNREYYLKRKELKNDTSRIC